MDAYMASVLGQRPADARAQSIADCASITTASGRAYKRCLGCGAYGGGVVKGNGCCDSCNRSRGDDAAEAPGSAAPAGAKRSRQQFEAQPAAALPEGFFDAADDEALEGLPPAAGAVDGGLAHRGAAGAGSGGGELSADEVAALLAAAEEAAEQAPSLDLLGVKRLLLALEKKFNKNQLARAKFGDQPARFLESEMELDAELKALRVLAAAPELYPALVSSDSLTTLLSLLSHDNSDIAMEVVALLAELTDDGAISSRAEALAPLPEDEDDDGDEDDGGSELAALRSEALAAARKRSDTFQCGVRLIDAIAAASGLELLVQHVGRLDEARSEEDSQGVYTALGLLQNIVEAQPALAARLCDPDATKARTPLLAFLLRRLRAKAFDANKLAASELLAVLLAAGGAPVAERLGGTLFHLPPAAGAAGGVGHAVDGVEYLCEVLNGYKKRQPGSADEEEAVGNLFGALAACLLLPANQARFVAAEGVELMLRIVGEHGFARLGALKSLSYALAGGHAAAALALVAGGGLRQVFPAWMARGAAHTRRAHGAPAVREEEEHAVSLVGALLQLLPEASRDPSAPGCARFRLLGKFREGGYDKAHRGVELFVAYRDRVAAAEREGGGGGGGGGASDELRYLRRVDAGLVTLQRLCVVLAALAADGAGVAAGGGRGGAPQDPAAAQLAEEVSVAVRSKLYEQGCSLREVGVLLEEYQARLAGEAAAGGEGAVGEAAYLAALLPALAAAAGARVESESESGPAPPS